MSNFCDDSSKGKPAEEMVYLHMIQKHGKENIKDVRGECLSYDFIVKDKKLEVKNTYKDGNCIILEWIGAKGEPGWGQTSNADLIAFVSTSTRTVIIVSMADIRTYLNRCSKTEKPINNRKSYGDFGDIWKSSFYRVNLSQINHRVVKI
jgi:hypothetical protein